MFNIVLIHPQIPQNTGNIGRLCAANNARLHLIEPMGFELNDANVKRGGLDYWPYLKLKIYSSWANFISLNQESSKKGSFYFFSAKANNTFWDISFNENDFLIFGREADGLPDKIREKHSEELYKIPILNEQIRSFNLSNAVSIVLFEGLRQIV